MLSTLLLTSYKEQDAEQEAEQEAEPKACLQNLRVSDK
jgi:hypothetical protein